MSRPYTVNEMRDAFLTRIESVVDSLNDDIYNKKDSLDILTHSFLCMLDGVSIACPGYIVMPLCPPGEIEEAIENGDNWHPDESVPQEDRDIAGFLHEGFRKERDLS